MHGRGLFKISKDTFAKYLQEIYCYAKAKKKLMFITTCAIFSIITVILTYI